LWNSLLWPRCHSYDGSSSAQSFYFLFTKEAVWSHSVNGGGPGFLGFQFSPTLGLPFPLWPRSCLSSGPIIWVFGLFAFSRYEGF
jgi:hypothetical protein